MLAKTFAFAVASAAVIAAGSLSTRTIAMESQAPAAEAQAQTPASVLTFDQKVEGNSVMIKYAYLPTNGYIAIYGSDEAGKRAGEALGYVALNKGDHRDVPIKLSGDLKTGTVLWTSLYKDVDDDKKLDVKTDAPFWTAELPTSGRFEIKG